MTELEQFGTYSARVTPISRSSRRDVEVSRQAAPDAFDRTDIFAALRSFFSELDAEAERYRTDPVALSQALARMETLLADVRHVRDTIKTMTASALSAEQVRRLTVSGVVTVEATSEVKRTEWDNARLLAEVLERQSMSILHHETGEIISGWEGAQLLLETIRPEWRLTALRQLGIDPDRFCTVSTDDDGAPVRTPTVRIVDNITRRTTTGAAQ